jgi:hypothetical protein
LRRKAFETMPVAITSAKQSGLRIEVSRLSHAKASRNAPLAYAERRPTGGMNTRAASSLFHIVTAKNPGLTKNASATLLSLKRGVDETLHAYCGLAVSNSRRLFQVGNSI